MKYHNSILSIEGINDFSDIYNALLRLGVDRLKMLLGSGVLG